MWKLRSNLNLLNLNDRRLRADLDRVLEEVIRDAARIWVETALSIIPVWSAASHHTLAQLADQAGISVRSVPLPHAPDRRSLGRSTGSGEIGKDNEGWFFRYETDLQYLISNETGNPIGVIWGLKTKVPYEFVRQSDTAAFNRVVQELDRRLPSVLNAAITVSRR